MNKKKLTLFAFVLVIGVLVPVLCLWTWHPPASRGADHGSVFYRLTFP